MGDRLLLVVQVGEKREVGGDVEDRRDRAAVQEVHRIDAVLAGDKGDPGGRVLLIEEAGAEEAQERDIEGRGSSGGRFG